MNLNFGDRCGVIHHLLYGLAFMGIWMTGNSQAEERLSKKDDGTFIRISLGSRPLLSYKYGQVPFKPYVREIFSPAGVNVLLDAPHDHLHHHALMFALKVEGINFWEEAQKPGRQLHRSFAEEKSRQGAKHNVPGIREKLDWLAPETGQILLQEERTLLFPPGKSQNVTLLLWDSSFQLPEGKSSARLTGAHYHGLGMRFPEEMNAQGPFQNAAGLAGEIFRGEERLTPADWCAYSAEIAGKPVTVAMFGHPDNLRSPTTWFTMAKPFAYLSATMKLHLEPLDLIAEKPLGLRYGVAVWDGRIEKNQIDGLFRWWVNWTKSLK